MNSLESNCYTARFNSSVDRLDRARSQYSWGAKFPTASDPERNQTLGRLRFEYLIAFG